MLWVVEHANLQIIQSQVQTSVMPAAIAFLTGGSALTTDFTVAFDTSGTYGGKADVLELTPKQPSATYKQVLFVVDPADGHISRSVVVDPVGKLNDFTFLAPNITTPVKASWFQFSPKALPTYRLVVATPTPGPAPGSGSARTP